MKRTIKNGMIIAINQSINQSIDILKEYYRLIFPKTTENQNIFRRGVLTSPELLCFIVWFANIVKI